MMLFGIVATALLALALLMLLPPLLRQGTVRKQDVRELTLSIYRDEAAELKDDLDGGILSQEQYAEARRELEQRLLEDMPDQSGAAAAPYRGRSAAWVLMAAIPLGAVGIYMTIGTPAALQQRAPTDAEMAAGHQMTEGDVVAVIDKLTARVAKSPDDFEGWSMLARSYTSLGRYNDALAAFGKAVAINQNDAVLLTDYADVLAVSQGKDFRGRPMELILRALSVNPQHPKALALAGTAAFTVKQYDQAAAYWERLLALLQPGSESAQGVSRGIEEAKSLAVAKQTGGDAAAGASVGGRVQLSPDLASRVQPDDTLFIYARAAQGPPAPLAILRLQARDLPLDFVLDDSMAMAPQLKLSVFPQVIIGARITRSGQPLASSGDLQGQIGPISVGTRNVDIRIDSVVP